MKLIYCNTCGDIVSLVVDKERVCECGKSGGKYLDYINAEYWGDCIPLGFNNYDLAYKLENQHNLPDYGMGEKFEAFTIPSVCDTFKRVDNVSVLS